MKKQVFSLGASLAVLATMALSGFGAAAEGTTVFSDDFERDTLGRKCFLLHELSE